MKLITILISTIIINACGGAKEAGAELKPDSPAKTDTNMESSKIEQEQEIAFEYSAMTRGSFKRVKIENSVISVQKGRSENAETLQCKKEEWSKLIGLLNDVSLETLSKLEAPSKAHQYDGALAATLTVSKNGKTFQTPTFDHGKPPKEIEPLIAYILSLSKVE